jgi:hypothetical protein
MAALVRLAEDSGQSLNTIMRVALRRVADLDDQADS